MIPNELPVRVYRLIKERFITMPLSAEGAQRLGGRWNPPGVGILYTSAKPELTLLEQIVHLRSLPHNDLPKLVLLTLILPETPRLTDLLDLPSGRMKPTLALIINSWLTGWLNRMCWLLVSRLQSYLIRQTTSYIRRIRLSQP